MDGLIRLRVFVSSPGDVADAREVAAQTIERLGLEFGRVCAIEPYLWENEAMLASGHFQDSIDPPSKFDVVVLLLGGRLGTPLPEKTAVREYRGIDGRAPVTGTEWEFEEALAAARAKGAPDLLVYRSRRDLKISVDVETQRRQLQQLELLNAFWARHFADRGTFIGAFGVFETLEELAAAIERDLASLVRRRLERLAPAGSGAPAPVWMKAPFLGLASYEFEDAPIFFGRGAAVGKAMLQLLARADAGEAFLLILGASGSGKSSLAKAGVASKLFEPRRVPGAAFLRRVVFQPGAASGGKDLFTAFAKAMTTAGADVGLPELLGPSMTVTHLAEHLRDPHANPSFVFVRTLDEIGRRARAQGRMLDYQRPKLLLIVDQLEQVFADERISDVDRARFVAVLRALARSGSVFVLATMRSDLWSCAAEIPELVRLAEGEGRLDLLPASPAELSQMIRLPARVAGIDFETHPETGIPLDDVIAEEAANAPGALPLLSYLMESLTAECGQRLTYAGLERLGRLRGAIAARADATLAAQTEAVRATLPRLMFALTEAPGEDGPDTAPVAKRAPLAAFAVGGPERRLLDALAEARLVVLDATTARLAHEALISHWDAARGALAEVAGALAVRRMAEERFRRHRSLTGPSAEGAMLQGADLADAERLAVDFAGLLEPGLTGFISESAAAAGRRRARGRLQLVAGSLAALALIGAVALATAIAEQAQRSAQAQALDRSLLASEARANLAFVRGDLAGALAGYQTDAQIAGQLISMDGENPQWRYNLAAAEAHVAATAARLGESAKAHAAYLQALAAAAAAARHDGADGKLRGDREKLQAYLRSNPL